MKRKSPKLEKAIKFIKQYAESEQLRGAAKLPSIERLCTLSKISRVTVWKALNILKQEGFFTRLHGHQVPISQIARRLSPQKQPPSRVWEKIKAQIEKDILNGVYPAAIPFPQVKELQARYGVAFPTIKKALDSLVAQGTIAPHKRTYRVVTPDVSAGKNSILFVPWLPRPGSSEKKVEVTHDPLLHHRIRMIENECLRAGLKPRYLYTAQKDFDARNCFRDFKGTSQLLGCVMLAIGRDWRWDSIVKQVIARKIPVGLLDIAGKWEDCTGMFKSSLFRAFVTSSTDYAGIQAARYLLSMGHKTIAYISPYHKSPWSINRFRGLQTVYETAGYNDAARAFAIKSELSGDYLDRPERLKHVEDLMKYIDTWSAEATEYQRYFVSREFSRLWLQEIWGNSELYNAIAEKFDEALHDKQITAWVAANDLVGLLALDYLEKKRIKVPQQLSVIGFDNSTTGVLSGLTSFDFNEQAAINAMINHCLKPRQFTKRYPDAVVQIEGKIIERGTTRKIGG
jgi:DNA-binding LacI/PurR family transcriptional regulator/DNA-binding transcriptional regulator YhcF (GntR family)